MEENVERHGFELVLVTVNAGLGSEVLSIARESGVLGGTIFYGRALLRNRLMRFLGLADVKKEIVLMVAEANLAEKAIRRIDEELKVDWLEQGGVFCSPVSCFYGAHLQECRLNQGSGGLKTTMFNAIYVIVDKGLGESVVETATRSGARGGVIINARGVGVHETSTLFSMEIEPEKEVVMLMAREHIAEMVIASLNKELKIDQPGNGIIFTQDVKKIYGKY